MCTLLFCAVCLICSGSFSDCAFLGNNNGFICNERTEEASWMKGETTHAISFTGDYLGMTLPIITVVRTDENRSVMSRDVTVAYFLPTDHQTQPPRPTDNEILIEIWPATTVYTRSANKEKVLFFYVCRQATVLTPCVLPPGPLPVPQMRSPSLTRLIPWRSC